MAEEKKAADLNGKIQAAILSTFAADGLALGWHWIYNAAEIKKPINKLIDPNSKFHPKEKAGDLTCFGDVMLVLLQSIKAKSKFDASHFSEQWKAIWTDQYTGYVDSSTKATLANLAKGAEPTEAGSESHDFTPVGRISPLLLVCKDEKSLAENAVLQAKMTHNHPLVLAATDFFARVTYDVLHGSTPTQAIKERVKAVENKDVSALINAGVASKDKETVAAVKEFGASCDIKCCLPSAIHCIVKYEDNMSQAIEENIAAGGESATRAMAIATVLGAYHGPKAIPNYIKQLKAYKTIIGLVGYSEPAAPAEAASL